MTRPIAALVVLGMLAAGCGSTVQVGLQGADGTGMQVAPGALSSEGVVALDDGMTVGGSTAPGAAGTNTTGTAVGGGGGAGGGSGAVAPAAGSPSGGTAPATTVGGSSDGDGGSGGESTPGSSDGQQGAGRMGPGVTADEIVIGIAIADEASKAGNENLLGASGMTQGDTERYYEIVRDDINRRGGIAGRKIRYSVFRYSTADGAQVSQLEQEACARWTQDDRAFAAELTSSDNFLTCAERNQLATTADVLSTSDDRTFATYPHHLQLSGMSLTRQMQIFPGGLDRQRYFEPGYRLGIVTYDHPAFARAVDGTLVPALQRLGKQVHTDIQRVTYLNSNEELGQLTAEMQSAVLRFKSQGITHVLIVEANALLTLLFTRSAENQDYRPRYGLNSQNGPTAIAGNVPPAQFRRAIGVGWAPQLDVPASELPANAARDRCFAMYAKEGQKPADANNGAIMAGICERMEFLKAAVEAGGPDVTIDSFARGAEALGDSFPSYTGLGNNVFGPGRHAGGAFYRLLAHDADCHCFHYTSPPARAR